MHVKYIIFGLMVVATASKTLHHTTPKILKAVASNCTLPGEYVVTNFTTYTDKKDSSLNTIGFGFDDPDTHIKTTCQRNSTSKATGPYKIKYACDHPDVAFIYEPTSWNPGLALVERACPGETDIQFEATGAMTPVLDCIDQSTGTLCHSRQTSIKHGFDSLEPIPPELPM